MQYRTFKYRIITPMFITGANREKAELRAPSIKGIMRYWWRVCQTESNIRELRETEGRLFGTVSKPAQKSPVWLRVSGDYNIGKFSLLTNGRFPSCAVTPESEFDVILCSKRNSDLYAKVLRLALLLGGLGKRSRRGRGAVRLLQIGDQAVNDARSILERIYDLLSLLSENTYVFESSGIYRSNDAPTNRPIIEEIRLGKIRNSWNDILEQIDSNSKKNRRLVQIHKGRRYASPICISILPAKKEGLYQPVVTRLNIPAAAPKGLHKEMMDFMGSVLQ